MRTTANIELDAGTKTFASGLLPDLIAALRRSRKGDLLAVISDDPNVGPELEVWCRFTGNSLIGIQVAEGRRRWVLRYGEAPENVGEARPVGSRLWLYTNFDCNLSCDYCCVRSSPKAPRRALGVDRVRRIALEAAQLRVSEIFVTGGEPFMLPDIGEILAARAVAAPTTVLTNGMLFAGSRLEELRSLSRGRVRLQISLDSPTPERHEAHRGKGTWARTWKGIERARAEGFRVRLAATVSTEAEAEEFRSFLDAHQVGEEDRVIRRIALRGSATQGVALARADLVPEVTITSEGVFWHPVGAEDNDLLVSREIFPLAESFAAVRRAFAIENKTDIANIFGSSVAATAATQDYEGIAIHCAKGSPLCNNSFAKPDLLPDEPGGYTGFSALYGNINVQPVISPSGPVTDLDGNAITDPFSNKPGFPTDFDPSATASLGYAAKMLEAGVPVVYAYVADAHDPHHPDTPNAGSANPNSGHAYGPGEAGYVAALKTYDQAFGQFFARLKTDGIDETNTLFVVVPDENDHFVGGPPSPANCDGLTTPCTYAKTGEIELSIDRVLLAQRMNNTPFSVHSDDAPNVYINTNPGATATLTRTMENDVNALVATSPITGNTDKLSKLLADRAEMKLLHMITASPQRTPSFTIFGNDNYFFETGNNKRLRDPDRPRV
jgi:pyruvate-formate lyase-activating enzyme/TusA-related sulfurtransferase